MIIFFLISGGLKQYFYFLDRSSIIMPFESIDLNFTLIKVGFQFQISELTRAGIFEKFATIVEYFDNDFISERLFFASFMWLFSFLVPSFLFLNRDLIFFIC